MGCGWSSCTALLRVSWFLKLWPRPWGAGATARSLADALVETLRAKEMLPVLDNCEHLVEAAARLVAVLLDLPALAGPCHQPGGPECGRRVQVAGAHASVPDPRRSPTVGSWSALSRRGPSPSVPGTAIPIFTMGSENARAVAEIRSWTGYRWP